MARVWRFLLHRAPDDFLLATEEVVTEAVGLGKAPPTARINIFDPPAVLIGFNQDVHEEVNIEVARQLGLRINRRPSGGGAILMYEDAPGWELWIPKAMVSNLTVSEMYEHLIRVPLKAFHNLGVTNAKFRPKNDIEVEGRKISGTGIYVDSDGVLFCGTILLDFDVELMLKVLKLPIEKLSDKEVKSFEERITTIKRVLGYKPTMEEVIDSFKRAVREVMKVELVDGDLNDFELSLLNERIEKYRSHEWIYESRRGSGFMNVCTYKTPAGLIRVHVKVFNGIIENIMITGDFFTYPNNLVSEIESRLKWTRVKDVKEELSRVKGFIHGLSVDELSEYIIKCCSERPTREVT
ncbi:MAG: lipoate--protein ligase [Candidatus Nezhaarchaeota archaeon]|nr:lipoate--protein ligase [Candidatus Nezhaarchaeota archaeon]MCX8141241.1 lipoate--protein ligase [Candidatus Nezhaarchaeota archaeon]MDW8049507.1 lipoate--protein ligase [Nitrososphaerota archaeon]